MSEFKIVKCKSCDASLVELPNEKLKKCVQCGHNFTQSVKKKPKLESFIEQTFEKQKGSSNQIAQGVSNSTASNQTISQSNPQLSPKAKLKAIPKKPSSIIGTIVKWYIILAVASGILKSFF